MPISTNRGRLMSRQIWPSKSYELQVLKFLSEWLDLAQYLDSLCLWIVCSWSFDEFFSFFDIGLPSVNGPGLQF